MNSPHVSRHRGTTRSFKGCWTCRLRRKKCDEKHPVCDTCAALHITCHHGQEKPEWMDGGLRQEDMAEQLKREVKEKAHQRRWERAIRISDGCAPVAEATTSNTIGLPERSPTALDAPICDLPETTTDIHNEGTGLCPEVSITTHQRGADCTLLRKDAHESMAFGRSDTILLMFYLEHLLPFLFPFYHPSLVKGGRAWILEMMISSPVVRQATLCQSSFFFSLVYGVDSHSVAWETVLTQTNGAFGVLRQSLQVINGSGLRQHLHGAVRILASIMQLQRFEIAVSCFNNCQAHLNAALALFTQLLDIPDAVEPPGPIPSFNAVISCLGPSSWVFPAQHVQVPSAEQAAFRFSSTLLIFDDIVASTMLQEQPRLYKYHASLLSSMAGTKPPIDLEAATGCQNWVLVQIGEIAVLDAWKLQCKKAENLDVMVLVHRAGAIKDYLESHLLRLETDPINVPQEGNSLLDVFTAQYCQHSKPPASQRSLVTQVWAHAALIYLFVVVSGWQPASVDVRYHVGRIIELLMHQISPPTLLRTMVWPFCVAGCLAESAQEVELRGMVEVLQPPSVFGTVRKALDIMESVWHNRGAEDTGSRDLATCFKSQGDLVILA